MRALDDLRLLIARAGSPCLPLGDDEDFIPCTQRALPEDLLLEAARTAVSLNPANAPQVHTTLEVTLESQHIALLTSKFWGPQQRTLSVSFLGSVPADLRARIVSHMNAWHARCGIGFAETSGQGEVRISLGSGGYYSYLGTDVLHIPANQQTLNLQGFTMQTPESEYHRVVRHETGHTLGFVHEHMRLQLVRRLDPVKTRAWFLRTQGWNAQVVQQQVLTPLNESDLTTAPTDQTSIMCYQLPGSITTDGQPIVGGLDINEEDYAFAAKLYPSAVAPPPPPPPEGQMITLSADLKAGTYTLVGQ